MKFRIVVIGVFIGLFTINCASNKKTPTVDMDGVEQQQPIPVGSVEVQLEFIEMAEGKARVEVKEVLGYGASTDRLVPSQTIDINVHESLSESFAEMQSGTVFDALLAMQPAGMNRDSSSWTITEIIDR